eukprot:GILK01021943.1.p1 GENE.GILK01021943.1~~GILK01021943.1.p1  ORF type:complete len:169 (-),score=11.31 GILK01021943.1:152-658(-)
MNGIAVVDNCAETVYGLQAPAAGAAVNGPGSFLVYFNITDQYGNMNPYQCITNVTFFDPFNNPPSAMPTTFPLSPATVAQNPASTGVAIYLNYTEPTSDCSPITCTVSSVVNSQSPPDAPGYTITDNRHVTIMPKVSNGVARTYNITVSCADNQSRKVSSYGIVTVTP